MLNDLHLWTTRMDSAVLNRIIITRQLPTRVNRKFNRNGTRYIVIRIILRSGNRTAINPAINDDQQTIPAFATYNRTREPASRRSLCLNAGYQEIIMEINGEVRSAITSWREARD
ncbi:hypothetical protein CEXT_711331 [Caerostris extrusa]|uniref:Uncharacterized protein n=1 Tax=Caerostris extrusa TaxID=172846 RepID=A0AAV4Y4Y9_CAEEX|nr:hypothetical protein CEXT_711331 [Caerostris extrusa]